jgi:hypothetical protein
MLVAGVHFLPDTDPARLGWKALAVNLSDLAAMGALPRWVTLAGALPATLATVDQPWLEKFAEGLFACAAAGGQWTVDLQSRRSMRRTSDDSCACDSARFRTPAGALFAGRARR